jgi:hypothetical protein
VVRSTFTVLGGMRQPLVRRSWMRLGVVRMIILRGEF